MKKIYTTPATLIVTVQQQMFIAASPAVTVNSDGGAAPGEFEVKGDDGDLFSSYNVWDDDWSK